MPDRQQRRERLNRLAWLLDSSIPIPGTGLTFGVEALIGLVPVVGDLIGVGFSAYILKEAHALGVGKSILGRMALNIAIEGLVGAVPLLGDVFDAAWKANQRNVRLLNDWMGSPEREARASRLFFAGVALGLLALLALCAAIGWLMLRWLLQGL
jgi:hypothetical protein